MKEINPQRVARFENPHQKGNKRICKCPKCFGNVYFYLRKRMFYCHKCKNWLKAEELPNLDDYKLDFKKYES